MSCVCACTHVSEAKWEKMRHSARPGNHILKHVYEYRIKVKISYLRVTHEVKQKYPNVNRRKEIDIKEWNRKISDRKIEKNNNQIININI